MVSLLIALLVFSVKTAVLSKPSNYADLTERQMDDYADGIAGTFSEYKRELRLATKRHWEAKVSHHKHLRHVKPRVSTI
ncbi:hypothetical protein AAVH_10368 [Aphelenchoides avenae]|nr:hypothetical protein AAVH_10368 [Aphelenchus avenae]